MPVSFLLVWFTIGNKKSEIWGIVYDMFKMGLRCVTNVQNIFPIAFLIGFAIASENLAIVSLYPIGL